MKKQVVFSILLAGILALTGCAGKKGMAGVSEAGYSDSHLETMGLGNADDLSGDSRGPHDGLLGKRSFYFDFDSNVVHERYHEALKAHAEYLSSHPHARVLLTGNADQRGSREYNIALGHRRANAVEHVLRMDGVSAKQLRTLSYGAERPVAQGNDEASYQLNRRADLIYEAGE